MSTISAPTAPATPNRRVSSSKNPKEFADAEARVAVSQDAWRRNSAANKTKAAPLATFVVSFNGKSSTVRAASEREAWAKFCDEHQSWPSPKTPGIQIEKVADSE